MSLTRISTQMIESYPVQAPSTTPRAASTIADHLMRRTTVDAREPRGQHDKERVLNQLGSLRPFPPNY